MLMLRHHTHKTVLAWTYRNGHASLFRVSGEESVGFNQNSGDTTVFLKKTLGVSYTCILM